MLQELVVVTVVAAAVVAAADEMDVAAVGVVLVEGREGEVHMHLTPVSPLRNTTR